MIRDLPLASIRADARCQPRAFLDALTVASYADQMNLGVEFPPADVFEDAEGVHWLADGFHRREAAKESGRDSLRCNVRRGGLRQAILHSCAANEAHGLRRSNDDKRRAVLKLLHDEEWSEWSNAEVARRCAVSDMLVADIRSGLTPSSWSDERRYVTKHGTPAVMNTAAIGLPAMPKHLRPHDEDLPTDPVELAAQRFDSLRVLAHNIAAAQPDVEEMVEAVSDAALLMDMRAGCLAAAAVLAGIVEAIDRRDAA